jgi:hypothetical protein
MFFFLVVSLILANLTLSPQAIIYETIITVLLLTLQLLSTVAFKRRVDFVSLEESSGLMFGMMSAESLSFSGSDDTRVNLHTQFGS